MSENLKLIKGIVLSILCATSIASFAGGFSVFFR